VNERIKTLKDAVETAHKCKALHDQPVPVREMFGDKVVGGRVWLKSLPC
jgi:hypothetical protein